ncbi:MAG: hypothetical protein R3D98_16725, partial [Candidatus Krumholzibacteriia bacterium]
MPRPFLPLTTRRPGASLVLPAVLAVVAILGSCTSEDSNPIGAGLGTAHLDTLMQELVVDDLVHLGQLEVDNPVAPLDQANVLYLGARSGDASSILANFDFANLAHPDSAGLVALLTSDNVRTVKLKLLQLRWYLPDHDGLAGDDADLRPWNGARKVFA